MNYIWGIACPTWTLITQNLLGLPSHFKLLVHGLSHSLIVKQFEIMQKYIEEGKPKFSN